MELRTLVIIVTICIQCSEGIFIPSGSRDFRKKTTTTTTESQYSDLLHDLAVIKLKLETLSLGPVYIEGPYDNVAKAKSLHDSDSPAPSSEAEDPPMHFNEMAVLELIPVIIEQKRKGNVSPDEEATLKEIFGDLWIVIEEEVNRTKDEEMNPILKALLQSNNDNRLKRALVQHQRQQQRRQDQQLQYNEGLEVVDSNDIIGNSVDRVRVTRWPKSFVEVNPEQLSPQQRLMRHAAFQIRQWFDHNSPPQQSSWGSPRRGRAQARKPQNKRNKNRRRQVQRRKNKNRRNGGSRKRSQPQNFRPKRHNTEIYVDDNHGYFEYEDFEDHSFDDMMTKPRSMRSSVRQFFDEYESAEEDDYDLEE